MKKLFHRGALLCLCVCVFALSGCDGGDNDTGGGADNTTARDALEGKWSGTVIVYSVNVAWLPAEGREIEVDVQFLAEAGTGIVQGYEGHVVPDGTPDILGTLDGSDVFFSWSYPDPEGKVDLTYVFDGTIVDETTMVGTYQIIASTGSQAFLGEGPLTLTRE